MFNERNVFMTQSRTNKQLLGTHDMKGQEGVLATEGLVRRGRRMGQKGEGMDDSKNMLGTQRLTLSPKTNQTNTAKCGLCHCSSYETKGNFSFFYFSVFSEFFLASKYYFHKEK